MLRHIGKQYAQGTNNNAKTKQWTDQEAYVSGSKDRLAAWSMARACVHALRTARGDSSNWLFVNVYRGFFKLTKSRNDLQSIAAEIAESKSNIVRPDSQLLRDMHTCVGWRLIIESACAIAGETINTAEAFAESLLAVLNQEALLIYVVPGEAPSDEAIIVVWSV